MTWSLDALAYDEKSGPWERKEREGNGCDASLLSKSGFIYESQQDLPFNHPPALSVSVSDVSVNAIDHDTHDTHNTRITRNASDEDEANDLSWLHTKNRLRRVQRLANDFSTQMEMEKRSKDSHVDSIKMVPQPALVGTLNWFTNRLGKTKEVEQQMGAALGILEIWQKFSLSKNRKENEQESAKIEMARKGALQVIQNAFHAWNVKRPTDVAKSPTSLEKRLQSSMAYFTTHLEAFASDVRPIVWTFFRQHARTECPSTLRLLNSMINYLHCSKDNKLHDESSLAFPFALISSPARSCSIPVMNRLLIQGLNEKSPGQACELGSYLINKVNSQAMEGRQEGKADYLAYLYAIGYFQCHRRDPNVLSLLQNKLEQALSKVERQVIAWSLCRMGRPGIEVLLDILDKSVAPCLRSICYETLVAHCMAAETSNGPSNVPVHCCLIVSSVASLAHAKADAKARATSWHPLPDHMRKIVTSTVASLREWKQALYCEAAHVNMIPIDEKAQLERIAHKFEDISHPFTGKASSTRNTCAFCWYIAVDSIRAMQLLSYGKNEDLSKETADSCNTINSHVNNTHAIVQRAYGSMHSHQHPWNLEAMVQSIGRLSKAPCLLDGIPWEKHLPEMLRHKEAKVREEACKTCALLGDQRVDIMSGCCKILRHLLLHEPYYAVRAAALQALQSLRDCCGIEATVETMLVVFLKNSLPRKIVASTILNMKLMGPKKLLEGIIQNTKCPRSARVAAIQAFGTDSAYVGWIQNSIIEETFRTLLRKEENVLKAACLEVYGPMTIQLYQSRHISFVVFQDLLQICTESLQASDVALQEIAVKILVQAGVHGERQLLHQTFKSSSPIIRSLCVRGLLMIGPQTICSVLMALQDSHHKVQLEAAMGLANISFGVLYDYLKKQDYHYKNCIAYLVSKASRSLAEAKITLADEALENLGCAVRST